MCVVCVCKKGLKLEKLKEFCVEESQTVLRSMSDCGRSVSLELYQPKGGKHRLRGLRCPNIFLQIHISVIFWFTERNITFCG